MAAAPEFFFTPSCPYYSYPLGALSPLGDDEAALLTFAAEHDVEGDALAQVCVCVVVVVQVGMYQWRAAAGPCGRQAGRPTTPLPAAHAGTLPEAAA